jgi:hypothetical protein
MGAASVFSPTAADEAAGGEKEVEQLLGKLAPAEPHECGPRTASGEPDGYRRTVIALVSV